MRRALLVLLSATLVVASVPAAGATAERGKQQGATGLVQATARDAQQQILTGRTVQIRNVQTGQLVGSGKTDAAGQYNFPALPAGNYVLELLSAAGEIVGTTAPIAVNSGMTTAATVFENAGRGALAAAGGGGFSIFGLNTAASAAIIGGAAVGITAAIVTRDHKIVICHKATGQPAQTIEISESAKDTHMGHGDTLGACPASPSR